MTIRWITLLCGMLLLQLNAAAQQRLPNILWLDLEDLSPILSMYGDSTVETPNIDRLAREGVTFTNANATVGVCAPSRASIITGNLVNELRLALDDWMQEISDMGFTAEKDIAGSFWPGGVQPVTAKPVLQLQNGKVHLTCATPGATIGYKINHQSTWTIYTKPVATKKGETLEVMAHRLGYKSSEVVMLVP